jgi:RNA polymerase sigma-70 factor (ECF subfamily)
LLGATLSAGEIETYLARHLQKLQPGEGFHADLLDTAGKRMFLLGETHAVAGNEQLDLALLRYLHRTAGVRFYLSEGGYAAGELMNRYLANGDEKLLDFLTDQMRGSPAWNRENRDFWKRLGEWNRGLPPADRVRVVGVDVEHQREVAWRYLSEVVGERGPAPVAIRDVLARLSGPTGAAELDRDLADSLATHRQAYAGLLGDRVEDFELVVANLQKRDEYYRTNSRAFRERVLYETFRSVESRFPGAVWYGRWGSGHIPQRRIDDYDPFAILLQQDPEWKGKILSIWTLYLNSSRLDPEGYRSVPLNDDPTQTAPFAAAAGDSRLTLFRLDAAGSPLRIPNSLLTGGKGVPTDYVQYVALVQNASAAHPLHEQPESSLASARPVVVRTVPESGASDVAPDLPKIRITFSKQMHDPGWSFVIDPLFTFPAPSAQPQYQSDRRTIVLPVKLQPGKTYGVWINSAQSQSFRDQQDRPAVPYLLVFQTRAP